MDWKVGNMWVALIEFRRDPTRPSENRIPLGLAMGFESRNEKTRFLVLWTRDPEQFSETERAALGPTYRRLLLERPGYILRAFERAASGTRRPLVALKNFAEENRAALFVTAPQQIEVPRSLLVPMKVRVRDVFQEVAAAFMAGARQQDLAAPRRKRFLRERSVPTELPDPWIIGRRFNGQRWTAAV